MQEGGDLADTVARGLVVIPPLPAPVGFEVVWRSAEPKEWTISFADKEEPVSGRASVVGSPFAGTPVWFDDLVVERVGK